jgi:hypothetical protein
MDVLKKAMEWAKTHKPDASLQRKAAFANSVSYLVTGGSGGLGGPSLREHLVSWSLAGVNGQITAVDFGGQAVTAITPDGSLPLAGNWNFDTAVAHAAPLCFEPVSKYRDHLLQILEREHCFDDDPADLVELRGKSVGD